jgi:dihydrofolate reductase
MQFADAGLLDDLLIAIAPAWLGDGIPTLARRLPDRLRLTDTRTFGSGLVQLAYEVG